MTCSLVSTPMTKPISTAGGCGATEPATRCGRVYSLISRASAAIRRTSATMARPSSELKTKEPPRGRIMMRSPKGAASGCLAQCGPASARRCATSSEAAKIADSTVPIDGVVPSAPRLSHSSARSAPARADSRTPSTSSVQISTTTCGMSRHGVVSGAGEDRWRREGAEPASRIAFMS